MRETAFPHWQFALTCLFVLAHALYLPASPRTLWLALPVAGLLCAALFALACRLLRGRDLLAADGLCGRLLAAFFALLAARAAITATLQLCRFWQETAFPSLPLFVTASLLLVAGLRLARGGTVHLCMWALPTLLVVLTPLIASIVLTVPDWSVRNVLPLLPTDGEFWRTVQSCSMQIFLPAGFSFLLLLGREKTGGAAAGIAAGGAVLSLIAARNLLLLGAYTAARVRYPTFAAAGLVTMGDFFQRAEALIAGCLSLCTLARLAVLLLVMARGLRTAFRITRPPLPRKNCKKTKPHPSKGQ